MTERQKEINKRVYETYPKTKKEFTCWQEKQRLTALREALRVRLESEYEKENTGIIFKQDGLL